MKKLIILAMIGMITTLTSCSNESITGSDPIQVNKNTSAKSDSPLITYKTASEVYYKGEQMKESRSEDALSAQESIKSQSTSRRVGTNQCVFEFDDGLQVYLTQVSGNGQASTYWITFVDSTGMHTYQNPGLTCNNIRENLGLLHRSSTAKEASKEELAAIDILKGGMAGRIYQGGTSAYISCHTDYLDLTGHACVYSNGYLFNVSWSTVGILEESGAAHYETYYHATQTSFCNCK